MKFLKHIRSKQKLKNDDNAEVRTQSSNTAASYTKRWRGYNLLAAKAPLDELQFILQEIFTYVCPHALDQSYLASEESMIEDGCMLCDMRDLAQCAMVSRRWNDVAQNVLYRSVRIDAVHYCEREIDLAQKRKRKSFLEKNGVPKDAPAQRLQLFWRTVHGNDYLAVKVRLLKTPYMTRETCIADLARTVSVLPNLQYVDLPEGFFSDEVSSHTLKQELQARCPDIRKMKYFAGSEESFMALSQKKYWQNLETIELSHLSIEPSTLLRVLGTLPVLRELKMTDLPWLDDSVFESSPRLPAFPPLQRLSLDSTPNITAAGLQLYLSSPSTREALTTLILTSTGILPSTLYTIISSAPHLITLSIVEEMSRSFPIDPTPPMTSHSLQTLHYEITSSASAHGIQRPAESHYDYLARSVLSSSLPSLRSLYVRDPTFPESLLLTPPAPSFASHAPTQRGFQQSLDIYSKGLDELEWNFTSVSPPSALGKRGSASVTRPISAYRMSGIDGTGGSGGGLSPPWGGDARKSVMVGNGFGGFLAVPSEEGGGNGGSPNRGHGKRASRQDLWR
ncbi:MAG: hypothetical protein M1827_000371 [Pycnora praestabilis]|nr:MAG: hypothetical protein M1827_000371 [Pycnora praestabilis]